MGRETTRGGRARVAAAALAAACSLGSLAWAEEGTGGAEEGPPPELTLIRVSSAEPGVEVTIDGHPCGQTPALVEVAPGRHEVVLGRAGEGQVTSTIVAVEGRTVELRVEMGPGPREPVRPPPGPPVRQTADDERAGVGGAREAEPGDEAEGEEGPVEPWHRRVPTAPWFELSFVTGAFWRDYELPINDALDTMGRTEARLTTAGAGEAILGGRLLIFPFASAQAELLRGLGIEGAVATVVGMDLESRFATSIDCAYYEADAGAVYRILLGTADLGASIEVRLGWHRTDFDISDVGNDLVPPFTYDAFRLGAGLRVPVGTRHIVAELWGGYLAMIGIGDQALSALNGSGAEPALHGGELGVGLLGRVGGLELGISYRGRWFSADHIGVGRGFGFEPTTVIGAGGRGIEAMDTGWDSYQALLVTLGYRYREAPGSRALSSQAGRDATGTRDRW